MRTSSIVILTGVFAISLSACKQNASETASAAPTPAASTSTTTAVAGSGVMTQTVTTTTTTFVTADPVIASQRNAARRREYKTSTYSSPARKEVSGSARQHEVAGGSILRVAFDKTVSTATAKPGDKVEGELLDDLLAADGTVVAPSGSRVVGQVENVAPSGTLGGVASMTLRLKELTPQGGRPVPIASSAYERSGETHTKHDAEYIAGGAAVGALLGQIFGKDTKSTLIGTAAGAAAGTGVAAATGKLDFEVEAGRTIAFTLREPIWLPAAR